MIRAILAICVVTLTAVTAGCTMCAHPFDYCGPTFTGECGQPCAANARAGSILSPGSEMVGGTEMVPGTVIAVADAKSGSVDRQDAVDSGSQELPRTGLPGKPVVGLRGRAGRGQ